MPARAARPPWAGLLVLAFFFLSLLAQAAAVNTGDLEKSISSHVDDVPEFSAIRKEAASRGLRVWMLGGSASSFGEHAKQSIQPNFLPNRLQWDFNSFLLPEQDVDMVITKANGQKESPAEVDAFLDWVKARYPYTNDGHSRWDAIGLTTDVPSRHKMALEGNPDFLNQNNDSLSLGMVEITQPRPGESRIKDLAATPSFLHDVAGDEFHFFPSSLHASTARFKVGDNPPILSAIRALEKALRYNKGLDPKSVEALTKIIRAWDPQTVIPNSYVSRYLSGRGKRIIAHAADLELALQLLDHVGLRQKLQQIPGADPQQVESLAWWLNKKPLPSEANPALLSQATGQTAGSLGIKKAYHWTADSTHRLITFNYDGVPRVFESRVGINGENAGHGNGFYTFANTSNRTAMTQSSANQLIELSVDPAAREGVDFIYKPAANIVVWKNTKYIRVQHTPVPYPANMTCSGLFSNFAGTNGAAPSPPPAVSSSTPIVLHPQTPAQIAAVNQMNARALASIQARQAASAQLGAIHLQKLGLYSHASALLHDPSLVNDPQFVKLLKMPATTGNRIKLQASGYLNALKPTDAKSGMKFTLGVMGAAGTAAYYLAHQINNGNPWKEQFHGCWDQWEGEPAKQGAPPRPDNCPDVAKQDLPLLRSICYIATSLGVKLEAADAARIANIPKDPLVRGCVDGLIKNGIDPMPGNRLAECSAIKEAALRPVLDSVFQMYRGSLPSFENISAITAPDGLACVDRFAKVQDFQSLLDGACMGPAASTAKPSPEGPEPAACLQKVQEANKEFQGDAAKNLCAKLPVASFPLLTKVLSYSERNNESVNASSMNHLLDVHTEAARNCLSSLADKNLNALAEDHVSGCLQVKNPLAQAVVNNTADFYNQRNYTFAAFPSLASVTNSAQAQCYQAFLDQGFDSLSASPTGICPTLEEKNLPVLKKVLQMYSSNGWNVYATDAALLLNVHTDLERNCFSQLLQRGITPLESHRAQSCAQVKNDGAQAVVNGVTDFYTARNYTLQDFTAVANAAKPTQAACYQAFLQSGHDALSSAAAALCPSVDQDNLPLVPKALAFYGDRNYSLYPTDFARIHLMQTPAARDCFLAVVDAGVDPLNSDRIASCQKNPTGFALGTIRKLLSFYNARNWTLRAFDTVATIATPEASACFESFMENSFDALNHIPSNLCPKMKKETLPFLKKALSFYSDRNWNVDDSLFEALNKNPSPAAQACYQSVMDQGETPFNQSVRAKCDTQ